MALSGSQISGQVTSAVAAYGSNLTIGRSAGGPWTIKALWHAASRIDAQRYVDDNGVLALTYPALEVFTDATAGGTSYVPINGDTFTIDGRAYTVVQRIIWWLNTTTVMYSFLAD